MTITTVVTDEFAGQVNVNPRLIRVTTEATYAEVITAGFLHPSTINGYSILPTDFIFISYLVGSATPGFGMFNPSIASGVITLVPTFDSSNVVTPVTLNHIAVFADTKGTVGDDPATAINGGNLQAGLSGTAGTLSSFPSTAAKGSLKIVAVANTGDTVTTISNEAMGQASVVSIPDPGVATSKFVVTDSKSTQSITTGNLSVNAGNILAGSSGNAGTVSSFPATASKGSLKLIAVANTGDTVTTISNVAMGQASVVSIPDPAAATANFVVAPTALVSGNLVKASGTAGLVIDAGARIVSNTTAAYGGGGTSNAFTATGLTVAAVGSAVIRASTNAVSIVKALPSTNTLTITFSADPGADTTVDYIYTTASQA